MYLARCSRYATDHSHQYAINRSKVAFGRVGPQWEQDIVSEIDSALNAWLDSVPEHCAFRYFFDRYFSDRLCQYNGIPTERT